MGKQINYYMGVDDFRQLAQYALDIGCVICKQENAEIVRSNSVDIVMPDYKKYFFYLPEAEKALLQLQDDITITIVLPERRMGAIIRSW